jgi:hypothetical protein
MDNFYNEHKGYIKLENKLKENRLDIDLLYVVKDAILYGFDQCEKSIRKTMKESK